MQRERCGSLVFKARSLDKVTASMSADREEEPALNAGQLPPPRSLGNRARTSQGEEKEQLLGSEKI